ncbi:MAG: TROVE domain-containing protein [Ktedonobacterales bacterium]
MATLVETADLITIGLTNKAGGPSYQASDDALVVRYLMTGMTGDTFYSTKATIAREMVELCQRVAWHDPQFLAQAILHARIGGLMRTAPIIALVVLSTVPDKLPFYAVFNRVVQTPGDLQDFIALTRQGLEMDAPTEESPWSTPQTRRVRLRGMGRSVRRAARNWLETLSAYHAIKYKDDPKMPLRDVYRLVHGKFAEGTQAHALGAYLVKGEQAAGLPSQVAIYEDFLKLAPHPEHFEDALDAIKKGRLPYEKVTGPFAKLSVEGNRRLWTEILYQLPYMALLRNLSNLLKYGVFESEVCLAYAAGVIADRERVLKSKQFPHAFYNAYRVIETLTDHSPAARTTLKGALVTALDASVANVPHLGERVLVACDVSGSMSNPISMHLRSAQGRPVSKVDPVRYGDLGHLLGASLYKRGGTHVTLLDFDNVVYERNATVQRDQSVMRMMERLSQFPGGGTSLFLPFQYAAQRTDITYDAIVAFTDSESWLGELARTTPERTANYYYSSSLYSSSQRLLAKPTTTQAIRDYRAKRNPELQVFLMQLAPTHAQATPEMEPGVNYISGWSPTTLSYMALARAGFGRELDIVRSVVV